MAQPPRTTLEQWAILAAVVDHGGFARAAAMLHKSQSAVSYAVAQLQSALDLPLLAIEGRKAVLTEHGRTLLTRVRPLLRDLHTLESLALQLKQGWEPELALVVDLAFPRDCLLRIVSEIQTACPSTQIQLSDAVLSGAEEAITQGRADMVITTRVPEGFLGNLLVEVEFIAVAASTHPLLESREPLNASDLERHTHIVVRDSGLARPRDDGWLTTKRRFTVSSMETSLAMIRAGLGYAWLPSHIAEPALRAGVLSELPLSAGAKRSVPLYLVLVHPQNAGPATRLAAEFFQRHAGSP